ncbi:hypothetical protein [Clostridium intestinale]|uniref:Uncharacterized protein n=1 Tax=Clostridium intestinale DSM 6191 TaxID=1121320 RepID=A0A1M5W4L8_9CLOT|nr:hypothetical protein [Clostridium intestinale]SHH82415.1 hypothetical protein SAMN02745941_00926 [Clostridium intestinale DSM 6191]
MNSKLIEILFYLGKFEDFEYAYRYIEDYSEELDTYTMDELDEISTEVQERTSVVIKYIIFKDINEIELRNRILKEKENIYVDKYIVCFLVLNKNIWDIFLYPSELLLSSISKDSFEAILSIFKGTLKDYNINNKLLEIGEDLEELLYRNAEKLINLKKANKTILQKIINIIKRKEYIIEDTEKPYSKLVKNVDINDFLNNGKNNNKH